jgi:hypothetical protein
VDNAERSIGETLGNRENAMGFLSKVTQSWTKSSRLHKFQKAIAPPHQRISEVVSDLTCLLERGGATSEKERAFVKFLDLCETDDGVRKIMESEHLSRSDLKGLVVRLLASGLGEWIKGHYAALSTIAYVEPLQYVVRAERRGVSWQEIYFNLLEYWEGRIPAHQWLSQVPRDS